MDRRLRHGGFTLIELLTVVAIIAILAGMIFVVGPRVIEKAKLANLSNTFNQVRTACVAFFTKNHESYPPAYGYRVKDPNAQAGEGEGEGETTIKFHLKPYIQLIGFFRNEDMYDPFSQTHDTDRDNNLSLLEFSPMGTKSGPDSYTFSDERYMGNNLDNEVSQQMQAKRPLIYIPVNTKQAKVVAQYFYNLGGAAGWNAERWSPQPDSEMAKLKFPPAKYDDYVLISVGPFNSTGGILTPSDSFISDLQANVAPEDYYHVLALRAYYLATRDLNDNGMPDFNYADRAHNGEAKESAYPQPGMNLLPDGTAGYGPVIYHNTGA